MLRLFRKKDKEKGKDIAGSGEEETISSAAEATSNANADTATAGKGWLERLKSGLSKTSSNISSGIAEIFTKRKLNDEMLEELEELLIMSDMGAKAAAKIIAEFSKNRFDKEIAPEEVKLALAKEIAKIVSPVAKPIVPIIKEKLATVASSGGGALSEEGKSGKKTYVILVVGVNGNGKTTTMGKLAAQFKDSGLSVMMAAADTFRAAAVEQLVVWGERAGAEVISAEEGADAASVAYRALEKAHQEGIDVLLIDTAGRLHNKKNLMQELQKISRVIGKLDSDAPHTILQVLDGTTGQNALLQVEAFQELVNVSALVVTKLDGTAKGGVIVALAERFNLPIYAIGVGESIGDLRNFDADDFARSLVG